MSFCSSFFGFAPFRHNFLHRNGFPCLSDDFRLVYLFSFLRLETVTAHWHCDVSLCPAHERRLFPYLPDDCCLLRLLSLFRQSTISAFRGCLPNAGLCLLFSAVVALLSPIFLRGMCSQVVREMTFGQFLATCVASPMAAQFCLTAQTSSSVCVAHFPSGGGEAISRQLRLA